VLSGAFGALFTFALLRGISLEAIASILVAAGTLGLAYFTWQSVARTSDVIAGEDRRHQQGLAPLLTIEAGATQRRVGDGAETGIRVSNIGYGLALNVVITLEGVLRYTAFRMFEATEANKLRFAGKFDPNTRSNKDGKSWLNVEEPQSEIFIRHIAISALEADGSYFQHERDFFERVYNSPVALYSVAEAKYEDMFGNKYATKYLDEELDRYEWEQPKHLRIPNPNR
jgi:hypothetical protein